MTAETIATVREHDSLCLLAIPGYWLAAENKTRALSILLGALTAEDGQIRRGIDVFVDAELGAFAQVTPAIVAFSVFAFQEAVQGPWILVGVN